MAGVFTSLPSIWPSLRYCENISSTKEDQRRRYGCGQQIKRYHDLKSTGHVAFCAFSTWVSSSTPWLYPWIKQVCKLFPWPQRDGDLYLVPETSPFDGKLVIDSSVPHQNNFLCFSLFLGLCNFFLLSNCPTYVPPDIKNKCYVPYPWQLNGFDWIFLILLQSYRV